MTDTTTALAPRITTASPIAPLLAVDGYKHSHRQVYPRGTTRILINWTNRSNAHMPESTHAVVFGLQAFIQRHLVEAWAPFFAADEDEVARLFAEALDGYFGPNHIGVDHVRALHALGHLPLTIRALPEGTLAPIGVATLTVENTVDEFFWLPNYIETALSASIWHPSTVATKALEYRDLMEDWAARTGAVPESIDFAAHDFSFRGQSSIESAAAGGAGHLLSFLGTDSMPTLDFIDRYYPGDNGWVAASVPATEHSVMCVRGADGELETFEQILDVYPTGIVSAVSDGFDLFKVLTETLPQLKDRITARDGKLVIRPDSGDPVDIVTGTVHDVPEDELLADGSHRRAEGRRRTARRAVRPHRQRRRVQGPRPAHRRDLRRQHHPRPRPSHLRAPGRQGLRERQHRARHRVVHVPVHDPRQPRQRGQGHLGPGRRRTGRHPEGPEDRQRQEERQGPDRPAPRRHR